MRLLQNRFLFFSFCFVAVFMVLKIWNDLPKIEISLQNQARAQAQHQKKETEPRESNLNEKNKVSQIQQINKGVGVDTGAKNDLGAVTKEKKSLLDKNKNIYEKIEIEFSKLKNENRLPEEFLKLEEIRVKDFRQNSNPEISMRELAKIFRPHIPIIIELKKEFERVISQMVDMVKNIFIETEKRQVPSAREPVYLQIDIFESDSDSSFVILQIGLFSRQTQNKIYEAALTIPK